MSYYKNFKCLFFFTEDKEVLVIRIEQKRKDFEVFSCVFSRSEKKVYKFSKNTFRTYSFKVTIILLLHVITSLGTICLTQNCTSLKSAAQQESSSKLSSEP